MSVSSAVVATTANGVADSGTSQQHQPSTSVTPSPCGTLFAPYTVTRTSFSGTPCVSEVAHT